MKSIFLQRLLKFGLVPAGIGTLITTICLTNVSKPLYQLDKLELDQLPLLEEPELKPVYVAPHGKGDGSSKSGSGGSNGSTDSTDDSSDDEDGGGENGKDETSQEGAENADDQGDKEEVEEEEPSTDEETGKEEGSETEDQTADDTEEDDGEEGEEDEEEDESTESQSTKGNEEGEQNVEEIIAGGHSTLIEILKEAMGKIEGLDITSISQKLYSMHILSEQLERALAAMRGLEKNAQNPSTEKTPQTGEGTSPKQAS